MTKPESTDKFLNKYLYLNNTLMAIGVIILGVWALLLFFIIRPLMSNVSQVGAFLLCGGIGSISGLVIFILLGIIGKVIYSKRTMKCKNCGASNRADKYFCGNCGEKLIRDEWIKRS